MADLNKAYDTAINIRQKVNSKENIPGIDLNEVANVVQDKIKKKINLYVKDLTNVEKQYHMDISGYIKENNDNVDIYIDSNDAASRQRFTVAHELGHLLLHPDKKIPEGGRILFRNGSYSPQEREANAFASELLMPTDWTVGMYNKGYDCQKIARAFGVSPSAVEVKLYKMGMKQR